MEMKLYYFKNLPNITAYLFLGVKINFDRLHFRRFRQVLSKVIIKGHFLPKSPEKKTPHG